MPVSEHAASMGGSQIWLEPGEHFTLDEMLRAICVSSANDAAVAVAELVGGTEEAFCGPDERQSRRAGHGGHHLQKRLRAGHRGPPLHRAGCGGDEPGHPERVPEVLHYSGIWTDTLRGGRDHAW